MKIAIIGARGLVGRAIYDRIKKDHDVTGITRSNYLLHTGSEYDVLINANGNSHKFWANQNPLGDYRFSVQTVAESLFDFKYKKYIFISSIDAEEPRGHYGFNKRIAEDIVKQYADTWQIVRLCLVVGQNMNKGPVYNIKHCKPIYLTSGSTLQLISAEAVANEIKEIALLQKNSIIKLYGSSITLRDIAKILNKSLNISPEAVKETYRYMTWWNGLKESWQYLEEIL